MAISKVIYKASANDTGTTWMDVTQDTVAAGNLLTGYTATGADGNTVTGAYTPPAGSSYTLLATQDYTVSTSSTSVTSVGTISLGAAGFTASKMIYVRIRDKAGPRVGYFLGSDSFYFNYNAANSSTSALVYALRALQMYDSNGAYSTYTAGTTIGYGVYANSITSAGLLRIDSRYSSSYSLAIDGTYNVAVYSLEYAPDQGNPFDYSFSS